MSDSLQPQWVAERQASLSITDSRSLPILMSIESVMLSSHLIVWCLEFFKAVFLFHLFLTMTLWDKLGSSNGKPKISTQISTQYSESGALDYSIRNFVRVVRLSPQSRKKWTFLHLFIINELTDFIEKVIHFLLFSVKCKFLDCRDFALFSAEPPWFLS